MYEMKKTEQKPLYIREGRRFIKLGFGYSPNRMDVVGWFYNKDHSFSTAKRPDNIGVVIMQTPTERIVAGLEPIRTGNWHDALSIAKKYFDGKGELPTPTELMVILQEKKIDISDEELIWGIEHGFNSAWALNNLCDCVGPEFKANGGYMSAVIPILRIKL